MLKRIQWSKELTAKFWSEISTSDFVTSKAFGRNAGDFLIELMAPYLRPQDRILDYGSGAKGYLVEKLLNKGYHVATHEPSVSPSEYGFSKHPKYLGDSSANPEAKFDVVILSEVIEHLFDDDIPTILKKLSSLLVPGGRLVVTTPNNEDVEGNVVYCPTCSHSFHPWQHVRSFTPASLKEVLARHGFRSLVTYQADFSSSRHALEHNNYYVTRESELRERVLEMLRTLRSLRLFTLRRQLQSLWELLKIEPPSDYSAPVDRQIGSGTNIVFIGEKV